MLKRARNITIPTAADITAQPRLLLLGAVELQAHGIRPDSGRVNRVTELAAWLVMNEKRTIHGLNGDLWPNDRTTGSRLSTMSRLRKWCGFDENLAAWVTYGSLEHRISSDYTDWQQLTQTPYPGWIATHPKHLDSVPLDDLTAALNLVRNRPCWGVNTSAGRWEWAGLTIIDTTADIEAVARHVARAHPLRKCQARAEAIAHHMTL